MFLSRRFAFLLALGLPAVTFVSAQTSSSSSSSTQQDQSQSQASQQSAPTQGELTVQARIKQRREQRRANEIHEAYGHRYETYLDMGYLRFKPGNGVPPGPGLQRTTYYAWETGLTRFSNERLGWTALVRGYTGIAYVGVTQYSQGAFTRPKISQYDFLAGPTYRFYMQPKYSVSGRVLGGAAYGNFSGDTNGVPPIQLGLYPDGITYAASASVIGEYNLTPSVAFKLAPEYFFSGFGSSFQASRGFTAGITYRFGKQ